ncbi:unnamed protein product [Closterium sp. Yama58-4]|nr:unnamed protein product [Closterium sp. Yama58-4]
MLGPDVPHRVKSDGHDDGGFSFFGGASNTAAINTTTAASSTKEAEPNSASLHPFAAFSTPKQPPATKPNNAAPKGTASNTTTTTTTSHPFRPPGKSQLTSSTSSLPSPPMVAAASLPLERSRETDAGTANTGGSAGAAVNGATAAAAATAGAAAAGAKRQPRKKFIPEQGMSQMSWRKASAAAANDIARYRMQHQGAIRMSEVKRHKREDDAWTVVRGRVYNITPYLDFHPGGKAILMKGAGKDCTALFNKYHAWVNAEFLLDQCFLGMLIPDG